jgi:flavin reductase (DIM6/NTAB) family NADH-FMN oxidoreductase RutF
VGGSVVLVGALAQLDCAVEQLVEAGDHVVAIGLVEAAHVADGAPLAYWRGRYRGLREG